MADSRRHDRYRILERIREIFFERSISVRRHALRKDSHFLLRGTP
jgi:hypothetical protein